MKWTEAFQAMSEGKMVADGCGTLYRIHKGVFQFKDKGCNWEKSFQAIDTWIKEEYEPATEYNLTFIEAMNEVQKGNKVECERNPGMLTYIDEDGDMVYSTAYGEHYAYFETEEVKSKWRLVE